MDRELAQASGGSDFKCGLKHLDLVVWPWAKVTLSCFPPTPKKKNTYTKCVTQGKTFNFSMLLVGSPLKLQIAEKMKILIS